MASHPNRSAGHPARNPTASEVRAAREAAGLTQAQAAALVHASARNWQQWEQQEGANVRRMHPGLWELFRIKTTASLPTPTKMAKEADMNEYGKFESWEEMNDARERIASGLEDGDVQEHVARHLTYKPRFDTWWLPAVWSENAPELREKLLEELGPTSPSGHMSEECGWEIEGS